MDDEFPLTIGQQVFTPNTRVTVENVEETRKMRTYWNLQITNVTKEDAGTYECQISAKEFYTTNVTLNVLGMYCSSVNCCGSICLLACIVAECASYKLQCMVIPRGRLLKQSTLHVNYNG